MALDPVSVGAALALTDGAATKASQAAQAAKTVISTSSMKRCVLLRRSLMPLRMPYLIAGSFLCAGNQPLAAS